MLAALDPEDLKKIKTRRLRAQRYIPKYARKGPENEPLIPEEPKTYKKHPAYEEPRWIFYVEIFVFIFVISFLIYTYFYIDHLHYNVTKVYAHMGSSDAQHVLAHKYLDGRGVEQNQDTAMHWFRKAADNGHPDASYNVVSAHMQGGYGIDLNEQEIERFLKTAHEAGNEDATRSLKDMMPHKY